jgi:hypothetical protein
MKTPNLYCFFSGHKWKFHYEEHQTDRIGDVRYEKVTCVRCGKQDHRLCWVTPKDKE